MKSYNHCQRIKSTWKFGTQQAKNDFSLFPKCTTIMVDGFTLVYDITDRAFFDDLKYWVKEIEQKANKCNLLGNKRDIEDKRQVTFDEGEAFAKEYGVEFFETSA